MLRNRSALLPFTLAVTASVFCAPSVFPQAEGEGLDPKTLQDRRFSNFSTLPTTLARPAFTREAQPEMVVDLGSGGREPLAVRGVSLNVFTLPESDWRVENFHLKVRPSRPLFVGLNRIIVEYDHPEDAKHKQNPVRYVSFINHQPDPPHFRFDEDGAFVVEGRRVFPLGTYRSGLRDNISALPDMRDAGFNLVHEYMHESNPIEDEETLNKRIEDATAYLDRARELGLGVFMGLPRNLVKTYNEDFLARWIAGLSGHPALWMWYIWDEPHLSSENTFFPIALARTYHLLQRLDPNRPSVMLCNQVEGAYVFSPFCTLLWTDRYPFVATAPKLSSIAPAVSLYLKGREIVEDKKPVWPVLQMGDNRALPELKHLKLPKISDNNHRPSAREMRAQYHAMVAAGALAIITYHGPPAWQDYRELPGFWKAMSELNRDVANLAPVLLSREPRPEVRALEGSDKVMAWSRRHEGKLYYGFVNLSVNQPARTLVQVPGAGDPEALQGDGTISRQDAGRLSIDLPPAGTSVFALTPDSKVEAAP